MIYVMADPHFGHYEIIEYCNRPYKNAKQMDKDIIDRTNRVVGADDTLIIVGDYSIRGKEHKPYLKRITNKINCRKKILVLGNHDYLDALDYVDEIGFWSVHTHLEMPRLGLIFVHDPAKSAIDRTKVCVCGHIHDLFKTCKNVINAGVDVRNFTPMSLVTIEKIKRRILDENQQ